MKQYSYNDDVGDLNSQIDFIVLGMSKCGTTTLYTSLNTVGNCIKYHSDYTLERVYHTKKLTTKSILECIEYPTIFTLYREPISRKISQYYQYELTGSLTDFCLGDYSQMSKGYRTEVDENMVYGHIEEVTGINVLAYHFNKELGHTIISKNNITLIPCTLEKISTLALMFDFTLIPKRISGRGRMDLSFTNNELNEIYKSAYCQHFYTKEKLEEFKISISKKRTIT